uniref:Uncharacterized protein n=1 Tax=Aplanochytrium stocchinoi TaxID=215587 RepID=A0A7S3LKH1_9STRA
MVLYRAQEHRLLLLLRNLALETIIPKIQAIVRRYTVRNFVAEIRQAEDKIEKAMKTGNSKSIERALKNASTRFYTSIPEYDYQPRNVELAKIMLGELKEWERLEFEVEKIGMIHTSSDFEGMKRIYNEVTSLMKNQKTSSDNAKVDYYGNKLYIFPRLTARQWGLKEEIQECMDVSTIGQIEAEIEQQVNVIFNRQQLEELVKEAGEIGHKSDMVRRGRRFLEKLRDLDQAAISAVKCVSRTQLVRVVELAEQLHQESRYIEAAKGLLALETRSFIEKEFIRAKEVGDIERMIHREIRLLMEFKYGLDFTEREEIQESLTKTENRRERFVDLLGEEHVSLDFRLERINNLRSYDSFAKAAGFTKLFSRNKIKQNMLLWTNTMIPTSLTLCREERQLNENLVLDTLVDDTIKQGVKKIIDEAKQKVKIFKAEAKANFKNILEYTGEIMCEDPDSAAKQLLQRGVDAFNNGDDDLISEMYMQMIKQLKNPTGRSQMTAPILDITQTYTDTFESSRSLCTPYGNALALLAMMVSTIPLGTTLNSYDPDSDEVTFEDRVVFWILGNLRTTQTKKYLTAIHNVKYGGGINKEIPDPVNLRAQFADTVSRYSVGSNIDLDDGPTADKVDLYLLPPKEITFEELLLEN